jgi:hypothetical protein
VLRSAALAGSLLWVGVSAHALTPVAQDRHVFGRHEDGFGNLQYVFGFPATETRSAPDYASFSAITDGYALPPHVGEDPDIVASQDSTIGADQLDASGGTESASSYNPDDGLQITGESVYSVTFEVESPRYYTLSGQIDLETILCTGTTEARIRLTGASGVLAQVSHEIDGGPTTRTSQSLPLSTTLLLPAGTYTLEARGKTVALAALTPVGELCFGGHTSQYEVHLTPAAPQVPALPGALAPLLVFVIALAARRPS